MGNFRSVSVVCSAWSLTLLFYVQLHVTSSNASCGEMVELSATAAYSMLSDGSGKDNYDHNLDCTWLLRAPTGSNLHLQFTSFSLEKADSTTGKCYDFVEIIDGMDSPVTSLGQYCGILTGRLSQPFSSAKSTMLVNFHTDKGTSAQGFELQYWVEAMPVSEPKIFATNSTDLHLVAEGKILLMGEVVVGNNNVPLLSTLRQMNESMGQMNDSIVKYRNQFGSCNDTDTLKRIDQLETKVEELTAALEKPSSTSTSQPKCSNNCSGNGVCTFQYNSTIGEWTPACFCNPGYVRPTCLSRMHTLEGDSKDGNKTIVTAETFSTCAAIAGNAVTGSTVIVINYFVSWLQDGDEILVIQMQGPSAGQYEFARVQTVSRAILHLLHPLVHTYSTGSNTRAQIVRVPNYFEFRIKGNGKLTALNWNGSSGGIIAIRAKTFTVEQGGSIDANGKGFRGGPRQAYGSYIGVTGESWKEIGFLNKDDTSNNAGGGGSASCNWCEIAGAGSYGSVGLAPPQKSSCHTGYNHGQPGSAYGSSNLTQIFLGSGGGGGCLRYTSSSSCASYSGSNGGGIIYITTGTATLHGRLTSAGSHTSEPKNTCAGTAGGPGSGGSIFLRATTLNVDDTKAFNISGGGRVLVYRTIYSGKGGYGRARVDYDTLNGYSHLSASAKSIESSLPRVGYWGRLP